MSNFTPSFCQSCLALYFLLIPFSLTAQFSKSGLKNLPANPPELDQEAVPWLPFEEDWSTGLFETNFWLIEGNPDYNWRISGQVGNAAPSVEFYYNPPATNYQAALTSRLLSARHLIDGDIYLSFDLKTTIVNPTGMEFLKVQVLVDSNWITVWADSNTSSYNWTNKKLKITNPVKGNVFRFRFLAEGQNSLDIFNWLIDNISVNRECAPPLNLTVYGSYLYPHEVILEWGPPTGGGSGNSEWLGWNNGINNNGFGLEGGGTFSAAVRFTPTQLSEYNGNYLTKIRFFPYAEGSFVLKVWTLMNAGQLALSQPIDNVVVGTWNEIELDAPVFISGSTEIWFGYTVTHTSESYPAGVDEGPAVAGFGDMVSLDGYTWESMATTYALNYNWNIEGYVEPINNYTQKYTKRPGIIIKQNSETITARKKLSFDSNLRNRELLNYEVFKDDTYIGSTVETFYYDEIQIEDMQCYIVRAIYQDCVSIDSNEDCIIITDKQRSQPLVCYPIPADQTLNIESETELSSLIITNFNYRPGYQADNIRAGSFTINTSFYPNGIYLIRAIDAAGIISTRKFIVNH